MHSATNSVKDSIKVMKPMRNSKPYQHTNRTENASCIKSCCQERIFPFVYATESSFPWILTLDELSKHDNRFECVLGAFSCEIATRVMKFGRNGNSHDTIMNAINGWAAWGFFNENFVTYLTRTADPYITNKLILYNYIGALFSTCFQKHNLQLLKTEICHILIEHAALFPPTECTLALHEMIHCAEQIEWLGPSQHNNLFVFERINGHLKHLVQNKACPMASIDKANAKEEFIAQTVGYHFSCFSKLIEILSCMPTNYSLVKNCYLHF